MRTLTSLLLFVAACGGDPLAGTWKNAAGSIPLPNNESAPAAETIVFATDGSTKTFDATMDITLPGGLSDMIEAKGTYTDSGDTLTLNVTTFVPSSASDTTSAGTNSQCVTVGDLSITVCFNAPQENTYTISGGVLQTSVKDTVQEGDGATPSPGTITLQLTKH